MLKYNEFDEKVSKPVLINFNE
jgi:hypothetical protein